MSPKSKPLHLVELPTQSEVEDRLLVVLGARKLPAEPVELYGSLADYFELSALQRLAFMEHTEENAWRNRVRQARRHLVNLGFVDNSRRGFWILTAAGRARAKYLEGLRSLTLDDLGL